MVTTGVTQNKVKVSQYQQIVLNQTPISVKVTQMERIHKDHQAQDFHN